MFMSAILQSPDSIVQFQSNLFLIKVNIGFGWLISGGGGESLGPGLGVIIDPLSMACLPHVHTHGDR